MEPLFPGSGNGNEPLPFEFAQAQENDLVRHRVFSGTVKTGIFSEKEKTYLEISYKTKSICVEIFSGPQEVKVTKDVKEVPKEKNWVLLSANDDKREQKVRVDIFSLSELLGIEPDEIRSYDPEGLEHKIQDKLQEGSIKSNDLLIKENVINKETIWNGKQLINETAVEIGKSKGEQAVRIRLATDLEKHIFKPGGKIYQDRPESTSTHVPYSDGESWCLIGVYSLSQATSLTPSQIEVAVDADKDGKALRTLIKDALERKYAIKTDGNIYHSRPESKDNYVPYSEDGNVWVLLNVQSLSNRTFLDPQEIRDSANFDSNGVDLKTLIDERMEAIKTKKDLPNTSQRKLLKAEASSVGVFSGKMKDRLELSTKTNRFDVAYFNVGKVSRQNIDWVRLNSSNKSVSVDISSLSKRLGISREKIITLAKADSQNGTHLLELEVQKKIDEYLFLKEFVQTCYFKNPSPAELSKFLDYLKFVSNPELKKLCGPLLVQSNRVLRQNRGLRHPQTIVGFWKPFFDKLYEIDKSFFNTEEKVTKSEFVVGGLTLVDVSAMKIGESTGRKAIRVELMKDLQLNKYSILTDGNLYYSKPASKNGYVPYSRDGKNWVLINVRSLSNRTLLDSSQIMNAVANDPKGDKLKRLIDKRMAVISYVQTYANELYKKIDGETRLSIISQLFYEEKTDANQATPKLLDQLYQALDRAKDQKAVLDDFFSRQFGVSLLSSGDKKIPVVNEKSLSIINSFIFNLKKEIEEESVVSDLEVVQFDGVLYDQALSEFVNAVKSLNIYQTNEIFKRNFNNIIVSLETEITQETIDQLERMKQYL